MIDREKVVSVLKKRFPGAPEHQVAAAANAIVGLGDEWEELVGGSFVTDAQQQSGEFRIFRKRESL